MPTANKLYVIGIGYRPLEQRAREILAAAEVIIASSRLADVFTRYDDHRQVEDRITVINKVPDTIVFIRERLGKAGAGPVVLLASGDPFFFGIGRRICEEFGKERVEILPDLSSGQQAFARINVPWDDAFFISLHGGPEIAKRRTLPYETRDIPMLVERHGKLGILTDRENNPGVIARVLANARLPVTLYVCERLGYSDEKVSRGTPDRFATMSFAEPNVVIVIRDRAQARQQKLCFGLREEEIEHDRGLITKDEVRAVTLHKLRIPLNGVMWDIGAGSGSVSLEAAQLSPGLRIFAVEKERDRAETIRKNITRLGITNVTVVAGVAPEGLEELPGPDRVFIGGSGGNMAPVMHLVFAAMRSGIVVVNCATLETLNEAIGSLEKQGFDLDVTEISVSRSKLLAGRRQMTALNPVFIVKGEKA